MHRKTKSSLLLLSEKNLQACEKKSLIISTAKTADMTNSEQMYSWKHYRKCTNSCKKDSQISFLYLNFNNKKNNHWQKLYPLQKHI